MDLNEASNLTPRLNQVCEEIKYLARKMCELDDLEFKGGDIRVIERERKSAADEIEKLYVEAMGILDKIEELMKERKKGARGGQ